MGFSQQKYINQYNKDNYKIYQFRVKKDDEVMIRFLDNLENRNQFILSLLKPESLKKIYTIDEIAHLLESVLKEYGVKKAYVFGSYARGEATKESDVDIFADSLDHKKPWGAGIWVDIKEALNKEIDLIFKDSVDPKFYDCIKDDLVQIYPIK